MTEVLKLTIKPYKLADIKSRKITEYAREIRPNTQKKYCELDEDGFVKDIDGVLQARHYDVIQFKAGQEYYSCKVEDAHIELFEDENGNLITYEENNEEYFMAQVVYSLGEEVDIV